MGGGRRTYPLNTDNFIYLIFYFVYMHQKKHEILVKYIVNLSRGVDNCWSHMVIQYINKKFKNKEMDSKSLPIKKSEIDALFDDKLFNALYKRAVERDKHVKINTVPYNLTIVIFVTAFETFLYDIFSSIVNSDERLKKKIFSSDHKLPIKYFEEYKKGKMSIADIIIEVKRFNFQNLDSVNEAFEWAININVLNYLDYRDKSGNNRVKKLKEIIEIRHKIVHEMYNDNEMTWEKITKIHAFFVHVGVTIYGRIKIKI